VDPGRPSARERERHLPFSLAEESCSSVLPGVVVIGECAVECDDLLLAIKKQKAVPDAGIGTSDLRHVKPSP
jgi:hypothetical protein